PGHYQWTIAELGAYASEFYSVTFTVTANAALIGTEITATSIVLPDPADAAPANDPYSISRTIVGSYDPNDKLVSTSSQVSAEHYFLDIDDHVDYTIRFQNTGTAPAINVYLLDTIAAELDMMSLQILAASHSFSASIEDGRVLRFDFPGIMLPDSSADLLGSQGFVSFRMKPIDGLILGTLVSNEADIYFDFNEPIRTNAAELVIDITVGLNEGSIQQIALYPNPANEMIVLELGTGNWKIELIGVDGRIVRTLRNAGSRTVLDLDGIAPGHYMIKALGDHGQRSVAKFVRQ
ncbi:MAG: T9SS type A sorting domain-containing protein, partial [Bacteroidota bacterium]|nr:T9SS type A sorting domain-containing protein [Bacteroidota bacterium]